jgi:CheY-like chemotaxis protein
MRSTKISVMPEMGAAELYRESRKIDPEVKMVLITGSPLNTEGRELLEAGALAWLRKPYRLDKVTSILNTALRN